MWKIISSYYIVLPGVLDAGGDRYSEVVKWESNGIVGYRTMNIFLESKGIFISKLTFLFNKFFEYKKEVVTPPI